ncbi:MAG: GIY-YIG nuclease family protein [Candidatus Harrisonbacteria bacterium]|nr:GIY-YIG nuclease family protein [Candidatus Harrisonbacteria bacterium]
MKPAIVKRIRDAPKDPGVYIFYGKQSKKSKSHPNATNTPLYVGKAANLRARLKSYLKITDAKTDALDKEATKLSYMPLRSEIEALIEESRLIKELKPKYNILWQDDKSYLYVGMTRHTYPKIFITHKNLDPKRYTLNPSLIGPFTDGNALRLVMKLLRRHFPYCTCFRPHLRDCLNAQIGLCLGFCCKKDSSGNSEQYKKNIHAIKMILRGRGKKFLKNISNEKEKYALNKIMEHREYIHSEKSIFPEGAKIECYDNSHLSGKEAVGALTALVKRGGSWMPDKNSYRMFKIKSAPTQDDPRMIAEVLERRLKHVEWPYPDLIIIDGGITQYKAALRARAKFPEAKKIKIVSFAKPNKQIIGWENAPEELKKLAEQAIYQTHNFVIRYHRRVRQKAMFNIE